MSRRPWSAGHGGAQEQAAPPTLGLGLPACRVCGGRVLSWKLPGRGGPLRGLGRADVASSKVAV